MMSHVKDLIFILCSRVTKFNPNSSNSNFTAALQRVTKKECNTLKQIQTNLIVNQNLRKK